MSFLPSVKLPIRPSGKGRNNADHVSQNLVESAQVEVSTVLNKLNTNPNGLTQAEVGTRLGQYGPNQVAKEKRRTWLLRLWDNIKNPLVLLLITLGIISYLTGDLRGTIVILLIVILGIVLRYVQESRA